jgi:hypothetical protein
LEKALAATREQLLAAGWVETKQRIEGRSCSAGALAELTEQGVRFDDEESRRVRLVECAGGKGELGLLGELSIAILGVATGEIDALLLRDVSGVDADAFGKGLEAKDKYASVALQLECPPLVVLETGAQGLDELGAVWLWIEGESALSQHLCEGLPGLLRGGRVQIQQSFVGAEELAALLDVVEQRAQERARGCRDRHEELL